MEDIEVNMNLLNNVEPSSVESMNIQHPTKQNKTASRAKLLNPVKKAQRIIGKKTISSRKPKWFIEQTSYVKSKDGDEGRLTKIATKRRKYTKSKNELIDNTNKNLIQDSIQKLMPVPTTNGTSRLLPVVDLLEKYNFKYEVMPESLKHDNFFLQDKYMNAFFTYYPEYVCIDFLCEIPELELNLCLFISVDGNGYCEIVTIGLIKSFDSGLLWLSEVFKKYNPNWRKIKVITCDKRDNSLEVIKMAFPEKLTLVSFFHSLKALKNDLLNLDPEVTEQDVKEVINIFERMVYASDELSYNELLKQMKLMPPSIVTFFRKAWHHKKETWALGHQLNSKIFLKSCYSYLHRIRKEIRPMVNTQDSVENVIEKLCVISETLRKERFQKFSSVFHVASINLKQGPLQKYGKFLTKYATELVFEQFNNSIFVKNVRKLSCGKYICASEDIVTINACSCNFFQLFSLPCSHILVVRKHLSFPLFAETLCSHRWITKHYNNIYIDLQNSSLSENKKVDFENDSGKFQNYFKVCSELWPLLTESSESVSQARIQVFKNLLEVWRNGIKVNIKTSEISNNSISTSTVPLEEISTDYWKEIHGVSLTDILESDNDLSSLSVCSEFSNKFI